MRNEIIQILRINSDFVSGEALSRKLNVSRASVWKHIHELRRDGYEIEAVTNRGYRLKSAPDKLLPTEIQSNLSTRYVGKIFFYYDSLPSTMDEAFQLAVRDAPEGTVVCADSQTKGRGRMGRSWASPKSQGVYMSIILRPRLPISEVAKLTLMTAVAICTALRKLSGLDIRIKWPNDLLLADKKLVGILTELNAEVDRVKFVVVGIGINVNTTARQLPDIATSLKVGAGKTFSRVELTQQVLKSIEDSYEEIKNHGFASTFQTWRELSSTLGKRIIISDGGKVTVGTAVDLAEDGGILIRDEQGQVFKRLTGDVTLLKG